MLYIHHTTCISPQPPDLFGDGRASALAGDGGRALPGEPDGLRGPTADGVYKVVEPAYPGIPPGALRRMSKAVRLGVGAAIPLIRQEPIDGILIGTGNGGMEESVKFLRQIVDYAEGMLAPGHFVQSIPNAIASQIGLSAHNRGYNSTYVHRGLGFEHALIDAAMLIREHAGTRYLVGGVDELSGYHYQIETADGWYKTPLQPGLSLYDYDSPGSIAGEGAVLFLVSGEPAGALAEVQGVETFHGHDASAVATRLQEFLQRHLAGRQPEMFVSGENGDNRALPFYKACAAVLDPGVPVVRYKHLCGEYPSASAFAVWLALQLAPNEPRPASILLYNNHKLSQHSFILLHRSR
jgi:hypothetical protein